MTNRSAPRKPACGCPIYCKYCGAKRKRDQFGHYCDTRNCQWQHGFKGCAELRNPKNPVTLTEQKRTP